MENLRLTPLTKEDSEDYLEIVSEIYKPGSPMRKYTPGFAAQTEDEYIQFLDSSKSFGNTLLGIRILDSKLIGVIALENVFVHDTREVAFFIAEQYRGKSYASKALTLLVQKLRDSDIKKLVFTVSKNNKKSLDIINLKLGAKYDHDYEEDMEIHNLEL